MLVLFAMIVGVGSFAAIKAVLESGHPMLGRLPPALRRSGGRLALALEFLVLVSALALARGGQDWAVFAYAVYGGANLTAAWLVTTGRV